VVFDGILACTTKQAGGNLFVSGQGTQLDDAGAADDSIADDVRGFVEIVPGVFAMNGDNDFVMRLATDEPAPVLLGPFHSRPRRLSVLAVDIAEGFELDVPPEPNVGRATAAAAGRGRKLCEDVADVGPRVPLATDFDPASGSKRFGLIGAS